MITGSKRRKNGHCRINEREIKLVKILREEK